MWHLLLHYDGVFALYYSILRVFAALGHSAIVFRSLSALCALLSIAPVYGLANALYGRVVATVAVAMYVTSAAYLYYATETRPYAMALLFCATASFLFVGIVREGRPRWIFAYVIAAVLAIYSHPISALFIAAHAVSTYVIRPARESVRALITGYVTIALSAIPLAVLVRLNGASQLDWISKPSPYSTIKFAESLLGPPLLVVILLALAVTAPGRMPRNEKATRMLLTWTGVPLLLGLGISIAKSIFEPRYFLYVLVPLLILAARGLAGIPRRWLPVCAVLVCAATAQSLWNLSRYEGEDWRRAVAYVAAGSRPSDRRIVYKPFGVLPYQYAFNEATGKSDAAVAYPPVPVIAQFAPIQTSLYVKIAGNHQRLWLLLSHAGPSREEPAVHSVFQYFSIERERRFSRIEVVLLQPLRRVTGRIESERRHHGNTSGQGGFVNIECARVVRIRGALAPSCADGVETSGNALRKE